MAARRVVVDVNIVNAATRPVPVRGIFANYVDYERTHLFAHPSITPACPAIDGILDFMPEHQYSGDEGCNTISRKIAKRARTAASSGGHADGESATRRRRKCSPPFAVACSPESARPALAPWQTPKKKFKNARQSMAFHDTKPHRYRLGTGYRCRFPSWHLLVGTIAPIV
uniref:Uncharacterized protein n=1 Tax=Oryza punctata TaxID=4537 RepID=A0A0E0MHG4_ORYPU